MIKINFKKACEEAFNVKIESNEDLLLYDLSKEWSKDDLEKLRKAIESQISK